MMFAILKEPKYYFSDTGLIENNNGAQIENIAACAFIKELHFVEDVYGVKTSMVKRIRLEKPQITGALGAAYPTLNL